MLTSTLQSLHDKPPAAVLAFLGLDVEDFRRTAYAGERIAEIARRGNRMQLSTKEIDALRGLVRWARTHEGDAELRVRALADAVDKAIVALENGRDSVTDMLLVGMWQSIEREFGNRWKIVDQDMIDFVGRELVKRYGQNPGAPRPEPKGRLFQS